MRLFVATLLALVTTSAAQAYTAEEMQNALGNLGAQADFLAKQSSERCTDDYKGIFANKTVKIGVYYGYEDYEDVVSDGVHAQSMAKALMEKCHGTMGACGFKRVERSQNMVRLSKVVSGKTVIISIYSTALTEKNTTNMDPNGGYWDQDKMSREIKSNFYRDLQTSDVVFYSGHSRHGSGFGFDPQSVAQHAWNYLFKAPLSEAVEILSRRPSRLKMLNVMSCTSDQFYRAPLQAANPDMGMALTTLDLDADNGEQATLGLLNSILTQKCAKERARSVRAVNAPAEQAVIFTKAKF